MLGSKINRQTGRECVSEVLPELAHMLHIYHIFYRHLDFHITDVHNKILRVTFWKV